MASDLSRSILEHIGDGVVSVDADRRVVFANSAACGMMGVQPDGAVGILFDDMARIVSADGAEIDIFGDVLSSGKEARYDKPMLIENRGVYVEDSVSPIRNVEGDVVGAVAIFRDVTETVRLLTSVRLANDRYSALFESTRSGIAVYHSDDGERFLFADFNSSAEALEGVKREDLIGRDVRDVFVGVSDMRLLDVFRRVWRTGKSERAPCAWYEDNVRKGWRDNYVYRLPSGEIVAVYDDVTDKKVLAERVSDSIGKLRDDEQRFRHLFEHSPVPTASADRDLVITSANPAFCAFVGYPAEELIGRKNVADLTHPDDMPASLEANDTVIRQPFGNRPVIVVKRYVRKDGATRWGRTYLSRVEHDDGRFEKFAQIIDITEQKESEAAKESLIGAVERHRKTIAKANGILSVECDIARRMVEGTDRSLDGVLATAGRKLGVNWLCVATMGETRMLGRWTGDGASSQASVIGDFRMEARDVQAVREWILARRPYCGDWDGIPPQLSKLARKVPGQWLIVPVLGDATRGQAGVVMMASKCGKAWSDLEVEATEGLATLLCVLARAEKNRGDLSRKIEETILELSRTVANVGQA
jgi:PAS domain S-box-containing protein